MESEIREQVNYLKKFIVDITQEKRNLLLDPAAREAELTWAASRFWAVILHKAKPLTRYQTIEQFELFKKDYENNNNVSIDDKSLFERFWLRNVLGFIELAGGISALCLQFKNFQLYKKELIFLVDLQEKNGNNGEMEFLLSDLKTLITEHENEKGITLNIEGVYLNRWGSIKDDKVKFSNFHIYFKDYLVHWDNFLFLCAFKERQNNSDEKGHSIPVPTFDSFHASYLALYPLLPSIEVLIVQNVIAKNNEQYLINFYNNKVHYWEVLKDEISGYLWESITRDESFLDDTARLKIFLTKTVNFHWPDCLKYCSDPAAKRFLDAAFQLVINENDLEGADQEFAKICIDNTMSHNSIAALNSVIASEKFVLNNSSVYEILVSFNIWEHKAQMTYLHSQHSRNLIAYLINIIVCYDKEFDNANSHFNAVKTFLRAGIQKPYLIWKITRTILNHRQEIIPYLLTEPDLGIVVFILLNELKITAEYPGELAINLWKKATELFLAGLLREDTVSAAEKIFKLYRELNITKYDIPYNRTNRRGNNETVDIRNKKEQQVLSIIEDCKVFPQMRRGFNNPYFFPTLFSDLATIVIDLKIPPLYNNGTTGFPILQWDAISWMLRASTNWKFKEQFSLMGDGVQRLSNTFLQQYLANVEGQEIMMFDFFKGKEELKLPTWNEKIERLQYMNWLYQVYFIYKDGRLDEFLTPRINIEKTTDLYHKKNNFSADKLRTHLGVLLQILRELLEPTIPYGFENDDKKKIAVKIENRINQYIRLYVVDDHNNGRIDLFSFNRELRFKETGQEALFPQIARAINWFTDKDSIINSITASGDISKILILLKYCSSEGIKQKLILKIKELNIVSFLENYNWIPEVQNSLVNLTKFPELIDEIESAILLWKEKVLGRQDTAENKMILYHAELTAAYFKGDEQKLEQIEIPKQNYISSSELSPYHYKEFYKGLLDIVNKPVLAYQIFNNLLNQFPDYISFALNRMVAKINEAEISRTTSNYREALEEWKTIENTFDASAIENMEPELSINILTVLNRLGEYKELEKRYWRLDLLNRMEPAMLGIMIRCLITQKKTIEIANLLSAAKSFHEFSGIAEIQFIKELETEVTGIDNIDELRQYYLNIYSSTPAKLVKIFPPRLNGKDELVPFLIKEIILAAGKMLEKIKSIEEIKNEDKYNDIIELVLDSRINPWGWHVGAQSRGAFSGIGGKQPGERDIPIMDSNKEIILLCEAWIYRGKTNAKTHLRKIFNYYFKRSAFTVLIYNTEKTQAKFENNWVAYQKSILPSIKLPKDYTLKGDLLDVCKNFNSENSAIKVGISQHESETVIYHIFVNLNYKV